MTIMIDITYDYRKDVKNSSYDPDRYSKKLKETHSYLWSRIVPNIKYGKLEIDSKLNSIKKDFYFSPDSITNSFKNNPIVKTFINYSKYYKEYNSLDYTIGTSVIFPTRDDSGSSKWTINQARGCNRKIMDRFDYTLECIRLFYENKNNPLEGCLDRYSNFFSLFIDFKGYVKFFFLDDLVSSDYKKVISFTGVIDFNNPIPNNINEYDNYLKNVIDFIKKRNKRIEVYYK